MTNDEKKACKKCRNTIVNCELCPPGVLFICTHDGSKLSGGCRRAYRTAEDLQTHANQRHNGSCGSPQKEDLPGLEAAGSVLASLSVYQTPNFASTGLFQQRPPNAPNFANLPFTTNPMMALQAMQGGNLFPPSFNNQQLLFQSNNPAFFLANVPPHNLLFQNPTGNSIQQTANTSNMPQ